MKKTVQSFWNKTTTYLINKKGIDKKIDSYLEPIKNYNDETDEYDTNYFYKINENNGKLLFTIYDLYLIEYYSFSIKYDKVYKYDIKHNQRTSLPEDAMKVISSPPS